MPAQLGHLLGGLLGATLMARDKHALPAMAPVVYALSIVLVGSLLGPSLGAEGFAWGVLLGSILGPLCLPLIGALREGLSWSPVLKWRDPDFRRYLLLSLPVMLAFSVVLVDEWIVNRIGSTLGEGVVARLQYARTLMKVPMGVFGLATGAAAYPTLSRMLARGEREEAWALLMSATRMLLVLALVTQAGLTAAGPELSTLLYGEQRFEAWEHQHIGSLLGWISIGLWAWSAQTVLARGFYAQQNTWMPSLLGSLAVCLGYPLYVFLADMAAAKGLAVASSVVISGYVLALSWTLRRSLQSRAAGYSMVLFKMALATSAGVGVSLYLKSLMSPLNPWLAAPLWGGTASICCLVGAKLLRVEELELLVKKVWGRLRRRPA